MARTNCTTIDRPRAGQLKTFPEETMLRIDMDALTKLRGPESEQLEQQYPPRISRLAFRFMVVLYLTAASFSPLQSRKCAMLIDPKVCDVRLS